MNNIKNTRRCIEMLIQELLFVAVSIPYRQDLEGYVTDVWTVPFYRYSLPPDT